MGDVETFLLKPRSEASVFISDVSPQPWRHSYGQCNMIRKANKRWKESQKGRDKAVIFHRWQDCTRRPEVTHWAIIRITELCRMPGTKPAHNVVFLHHRTERRAGGGLRSPECSLFFQWLTLVPGHHVGRLTTPCNTSLEEPMPCSGLQVCLHKQYTLTQMNSHMN